MYITKELLKEKKACVNGVNWFSQNFPEGCTLDDMVQSDKMRQCPTDYIWWFYNQVQQDVRLYAFCAVNRSDGVNRSFGVNGSHGVNVSNGVNVSDGVNGSNGVDWSFGVDGSNGVNESDGVNVSDGVNRSLGVNRSDGVNKSDGVNVSFGVNKSNGINGSNGVNGSDGVNWSNGVNWSDGVSGSFGVNESFGCMECHGIDRCLFCFKATGQYLIFNIPVDEARFERVRSTIYELLGDWRPTFNNINDLHLKSGSDWKLTPVKDAKGSSIKEAWAGMPQEAIEYIQSLPEYSADMFGQITGYGQ